MSVKLRLKRISEGVYEGGIEVSDVCEKDDAPISRRNINKKPLEPPPLIEHRTEEEILDFVCIICHEPFDDLNDFAECSRFDHVAFFHTSCIQSDAASPECGFCDPPPLTRGQSEGIDYEILPIPPYCGECRFRFVDQKDYVTHMKSEHQVDFVRTAFFKCLILSCDRNFMTFDLFKDHFWDKHAKYLNEMSTPES